jgi:ribosomal protein S27AE
MVVTKYLSKTDKKCPHCGKPLFMVHMTDRYTKAGELYCKKCKM